MFSNTNTCIPTNSSGLQRGVFCSSCLFHRGISDSEGYIGRRENMKNWPSSCIACQPRRALGGKKHMMQPHSGVVLFPTALCRCLSIPTTRWSRYEQGYGGMLSGECRVSASLWWDAIHTEYTPSSLLAVVEQARANNGRPESVRRLPISIMTLYGY